MHSVGPTNITVNLPAGFLPQFSGVDDLNGDGRDDVLIGGNYYPIQSTSGPIIGLINVGSGQLSYSPGLFNGQDGAVHHREFILEDFNGDGRTDVFVANHGLDTAPYPGEPDQLFIGQSNGTFIAQDFSTPRGLNSATNTFTHSAAAADIDNDGDIDLYVGVLPVGNEVPLQQRSHSYFLINDGAGNFSYRTEWGAGDAGTMWDNYTSVAFGDLNNDGSVDLVLGTSTVDIPYAVQNEVRFNDGAGNFFNGSPIRYGTGSFGDGSTTNNDILLADVNRDGFLDIIQAEVPNGSTGFYTQNRVQVLINDRGVGFVDETDSRLIGQSSTFFVQTPGGTGWADQLY